MPQAPDSHLRASEAASDSSGAGPATTKAQTAVPDKPAPSPSWYETNLGVAIIGGIISGIVVAAVVAPKVRQALGKLIKRIVSWLRPAVDTLFFPLKEFEAAVRHFIPTRLELQNPRGLSLAWRAESKDSLNYFLDAFRAPRATWNEQPQTYLLFGPTGIGKTTLLLNLYAQHREYTRLWRRLLRGELRTPPTVLLGRVPGWNANSPFRQRVKELVESKASQHTILLLDGLDEFRLEDHGRKEDGDFHKQFNPFWQSLQKTVIPHFALVIITAREQFFQSATEEAFQFEKNNATVSVTKAQLLPFTDTQQEDYLKKRFGAKNELEAYANQLRIRQETFLELPLLLTYIEELKKKQDVAKTYLDSHANIEFLVEQWLIREGATKGITAVLLEDFCKKLAYLIATREQGYLTSTVLSALEAEKLAGGSAPGKSIVQALGGLGNRSLLKKERYLVKKQEVFSFKFIHERFLEYFLACYLDDHEQVIEFQGLIEQRRFAILYLQHFIGRRWRAARLAGKLPAPAPKKEGDNVVPLEKIREWGRSFNSLTTNDWVRAYFQQHWQEILKEEAPDWVFLQEFTSLHKMVINHQNFWTANDPDAQDGIRYLRGYITKIDLRKQPLSNNITACLSGVDNVSYLNLKSADLPSTCLQAFEKSASKLTYLQLRDIKLDELKPDELTWFAQTCHLQYLNLSGTSLPAARLQDFEKLASKLILLDLSGIMLCNLKYDELAWFAQTCHLQYLSLNNTNLPVARLQSFAGSASKLTSLWLRYIELGELKPDELTWFKQTSQLQWLDLNNTNLPVTRLQDFANSAFTLTTLWLDGIELCNLQPHELTWFAKTCQLESLDLSNTNLPATRLQDFVKSASTLNRLYLADNPEITEETFNCFGKEKDRLIDVAKKCGWVPLAI